jgi:hypothetical protein
VESDLPLRVLYQLAAPKAEAAREEVAERIEAGGTPSRTVVSEAIAKAKNKTKARTSTHDDQDAIAQDKPAAAHGEQSIVPLEERRAQMAVLDTESGSLDAVPEAAAVVEHLAADAHHAGHAGLVNGTPAPAVTNPDIAVRSRRGAPASASAKSSKKQQLLEAWDATAEERQFVRELVLEQFFAEASGSDIYDSIPVARLNEVICGLLDKLTVSGMCAAMSEEFGEKLRHGEEAPRKRNLKKQKSDREAVRKWKKLNLTANRAH